MGGRGRVGEVGSREEKWVRGKYGGWRRGRGRVDGGEVEVEVGWMEERER